MDLNQLQILEPQNQKREYLSGGFERTLSPLLQNAVQVLNQYQDDLNKEFSDSVYEDMLKDPAVSASVDILKSLILAEPLRVVPIVHDKKAADYEISREVTAFVDYQIHNMARSTQTILNEALEAIQFGSSMVEIIFEDQEYNGRPILGLKDLKTRNRKNYSFIVDRYYNVLGAVSNEAGQGATSIYTGSMNPDPEQVIPREKFMVLALQTKNSDPRGISMLRPAWNSYYVKNQVWPQYLKYLIQFASPSLVGYTPENGPEEIEQIDASGNVIVNSDGTVKTSTPEEDMLSTLLGFQSGTVAVLKGGSKLDVIQSDGNGEAFSAAVNMFDRQIAMAILKTHRTLLEAQHGSKADAEASADITDVFVGGLREIVSSAFSKDVIKTLVEINFGPEIAAKYSPYCTLRAMPKQDFSKAAEAISKLWTSKYLHPSQVGETDAMIGLPERDLDSFLGELQDSADLMKLDQIERMKLLNPGAGLDTPPVQSRPDAAAE